MGKAESYSRRDDLGHERVLGLFDDPPHGVHRLDREPDVLLPVRRYCHSAASNGIGPPTSARPNFLTAQVAFPWRSRC